MLEAAFQPVKIPCPKDENRGGCFWGSSAAGYITKKPTQDIPVMSSAWEIKEGRFLLDRMALLHFIYFAGSKTKNLRFVIVGDVLCSFEAFRI